jgi:hypothetical protein
MVSIVITFFGRARLAFTVRGDMMTSVTSNFGGRRARTVRGTAMIVVALAAVGADPGQLHSQIPQTTLTTRSELVTAAEQAEIAANAGSGAARTKSKLLAAGIRNRIANGDFQAGDRIVLTYVSDIRHSDTLVVRNGPILMLPANATLPLSGVLRSELANKIETELLKYVRAEQVEVTPLTRVGVLGEVVHPGYFALRSDVPLAEAIMLAGGPTVTADVERSVIRRGSQELRASDETRQAITKGSTLDQLGLSAGDELVVGRKRDFLTGAMIPLVGAIASLTAVFVAVHH